MKNRLSQTRPEHALFALGLIFGLLSIGVTPPMQAPDETNHFYRAYQISEATIIPQKNQDPEPGGATGGELPRALGVVEAFNPLRHHPNRKVIAPVASLRKLASTSIDPSHRDFFSFSNTAAYSPIAYLPQASGIAVGRLFTGSPIMFAYLARITNLFAWLGIVSLAVHTTPILKWSLVAIALTPMSLFLAASASGDALTNALSWLFVAQSLRLCISATPIVTGYTFLALLLSGLGLSLVKMPYQVFAILPAGLAMNDRSSPRMQPRQIKLLFLVMAVGLVAWMAVVRKTFSPYQPSWDPAAQLRFLIANPAALCWGTFGYLWPSYLWRTLCQFVGKLGWLDTPFPVVFYAIHLAVLMLVAVIEPLPLSRIDRRRLASVAGVVSILTCWLVCFVVLVAGTGVGAYEMFVQGRYFLPVAPIVMAAVVCLMPKLRGLERYRGVVAVAWAFYLPASLSLMIVVLRWRYYI